MKNLPYLLIAVLVIALAISIYRNRTQSATIADIQLAQRHANDSALYFKDKYGTEHAYITQQSASYNAIMATQGQTIDSQAKRLDLRTKQIQDILNAGFEKDGQIKAALHKDTVLVPGDSTAWFTYADKAFKAKGSIKHDTLYVSYSVETGVSFTRYWKRSWLLSPKQYYIDGYCTDTSVHISGLKNIHVDDEYSRWSLGAYTGYDVVNRRMGAGLSLNYALIRFKRKNK